MSTTDDWLYSDDLDVGVSEVREMAPFSWRVCHHSLYKQQIH